MRSPAELTDAFRAQGLKITPQRQAIFRVLHENRAHPSADAVYAQVVADLPSVSLRTVYQTLNDLAAMGELQALDLGTGATRFDPNVGDHHHLVCERCGLVHDVELDIAGLDDQPVATAHGCAVHTTQVVLRGLCERCRLEVPGAATPTASDHPHPHHLDHDKEKHHG